MSAMIKASLSINSCIWFWEILYRKTISKKDTLIFIKLKKSALKLCCFSTIGRLDYLNDLKFDLFDDCPIFNRIWFISPDNCPVE